MDKREWVQIKTVVAGALALEASHRDRYIRQACEGNERLLVKVRERLQSIAKSEEEGFLGGLVSNQQAFVQDLSRQWSPSARSTDLIGQKIGPYEITDELASGGMGSVYKAERVDGAFHQTVAIKIIKRDVESEETIRRFKQERVILASLSHPNIARLYDGGVTTDGIPYLIMEFVDGKPIDVWCDAERCPIKERLALFQKACKVIQFAHQNMIVHRDLKPQNIFVSTDGQVKVLDFGIAKMLEPIHPDQPMMETQSGSQLWTPQFAAPEQVTGKNIGVATDVYALGALLYTLLGGVFPYDLTGKSTYEIESLILKEDPPAASKRVIKADQKIWQNRGLNEDNQLQKILQGDLDAIMLKAMRREPKYRYQSVNVLLDDLRRYESDLPLRAREDTLRYRSSKFWKRHKAALVGVLLLVGITVTYIFQITQERNQARLEAQKTEQVKNLFVEIFQSSNPFLESNAQNITVQEVLDQGTKKIADELKSQPLVKAELLETLGSVYSGLVMHDKAESLLREALHIYQRTLEPDHPDIARTAQLLGFLLLRKGNYKEAEKWYKTAQNIYETQGNTTKYAGTLHLLGFLYFETGSTEKALPLYNRAIEIYKENNSSGLAGALLDRGYLLTRIGKFDEAIKNMKRSVVLYKQHYDNPDVEIANALTGLGQAMQLKGNLSSAENYHRRALQIRQNIFSQDHTYIASSNLRLGSVLVEQGRFREAIPLIEKAYRSFEQHLPAGHWKIAISEGLLALTWIPQGKFQQAETTLINTHEIFLSQFGVQDWRTHRARQALAKLYKAWKKPEKAQAYLAK